jgi:hypothetical protein
LAETKGGVAGSARDAAVPFPHQLQGGHCGQDDAQGHVTRCNLQLE